MCGMDVTPLAERLREALAGLTADPIEEKRMFSGTGFMWRGRLLVGTHGADELVIPLGKGSVGGEGLRPMVMGERVSDGWFFVAPEAFATDDALDALLRRSMAYLETLPRRG
jgi:TfoX-like protein